ncbi:MAG: ATP-binding cassette domain-containing protein, partial [Chloroflexi bacterium]|nr:ATP-binding cassette domain-containing protein [Chloroflexota bacterium]NOG37319.1 ATP-binding cassette domain-containing protein [Chloroflexota bacterium]
MPLAINVEHLERTFGSGENSIRALQGVDLQIDAGQFVALKGRSGSGKTTLLNCLGGLDEPTAGTIELPMMQATHALMKTGGLTDVVWNFEYRTFLRGKRGRGKPPTP